jgi:hypothetical protein
MSRDLEKDLAICGSATPGPWEYQLDDPHVVQGKYWFVRSRSVRKFVAECCDEDIARFIAEAREGWPYAIRRALEAEAEVDRLRNELNILQEQLEQCFQL